MRILEIFSQGPWSTRVTSGYSSSLRRVLSERLRCDKANWYQTRSMRAQILWKLWLTSRLMHHVQNKLLRLVLHLNGHKRRQFVHVNVFWQIVCKFASWIAAAYPELVKQQVEDLSRRHGAVDSHVGHRTVRRGEYRRLKEKKKKERIAATKQDETQGAEQTVISRRGKRKTKLICIWFAASESVFAFPSDAFLPSIREPVLPQGQSGTPSLLHATRHNSTIGGCQRMVNRHFLNAVQHFYKRII